MIEKWIVDYIWRNIEVIVYMMIEELVKVMYIFYLVIICLCKKMGFSGFKEFCFELGWEVY